MGIDLTLKGCGAVASGVDLRQIPTGTTSVASTTIVAAANLPHRYCEGRPVLLLHGFLTTPRVLMRLARRLQRFGYCCHSVDLGGLFGRYNARPIEEIAHAVAARVEQIVRDHGNESIDVVGHSEGGLIGRYYVQRMHGARRVRHLITLGTPHRGTPWAYSGYLVSRFVPSLLQMAPRSALLRQLDDATFPESVRLTSIYSTSDALCPPWSCRLQAGRGAHLENVQVAGIGHVAFLFDAAIASMICTGLAGAWMVRDRSLVPDRGQHLRRAARDARGHQTGSACAMRARRYVHSALPPSPPDSAPKGVRIALAPN